MQFAVFSVSLSVSVRRMGQLEGDRVTRSFIKPLDVQRSAARKVDVRNCGALWPTQRGAYRSCRCWVSAVAELFPCYALRQGKSEQDI